MPDSIFITVEADIASGKLEAVKEIIDRLVAWVRETEPNTLLYHYFVNGTGTQIRIIERYVSVEAVFRHNDNVSGYVSELADMITFTRVDVFGDVNPEAMPAFALQAIESLSGQIWLPFAAK